MLRRRASTRRRGPGGGTTSRGPGSRPAGPVCASPSRAGAGSTRAASSRRRRRARRRARAGRRAGSPIARIHTRWSATCSVAGATNRLPSTWRCSMARPSAMCRAPRVVDAGEDLGERRHGHRVGGVRHRVLVVHAVVGGLERRAHRQDRLAVLDGVHPAGRERAAVAHPLDAEGDRLGVVAGSHEVGVDASAAGGRRRPRSPARCDRSRRLPGRAPARRRPVRAAASGSGRGTA